MTIKEGLRILLAKTQEREQAELEPLVDDRPPSEPGRWTPKDTLAHLTAWRVHTAQILDAARTGGRQPEPIDDFDAENANIYAAAKDLRAAAVIEAAGQSWDALSAAVDAASESALRSRRPRRPETLIWQVVPSNTSAHLAEHLGYLAEEQGDPGAAEAAARWARDLDNQAFPDRVQRGNADYNLACFFAKRGRTADALPLLRNALRLNPKLKSWVAKDSDLDPLRGVPEFETIVA